MPSEGREQDRSDQTEAEHYEKQGVDLRALTNDSGLSLFAFHQGCNFELRHSAYEHSSSYSTKRKQPSPQPIVQFQVRGGK